MRNLKAVLTVIILCTVLVSSGYQLGGSNDTLKISFSPDSFKVIDRDRNILQVTKNLSSIRLSCHGVVSGMNQKVNWWYRGQELYWKNGFSRKLGEDFHTMSIDLSSRRPPVVRVECELRYNPSVKKSSLIYTGVNAPPYIDKTIRRITAISLNETTVALPCLLKYPLDYVENRTLQLWKHGHVVTNVIYAPEHGYLLNRSEIAPKSFGNYKCIVSNSTEDDYVIVEVTEGSLVYLKYTGTNDNYHFQEKSLEKQRFECTAPKSMFLESFRWYFKMKNGSILQFEPAERNSSSLLSPNMFNESVKITFQTKEITHVVCTVQSKVSGNFFSFSVPVKVIGALSSVILEAPESQRIEYRKGTRLNCTSKDHTVRFKWYKDGRPIEEVELPTATELSFHSDNLSTSLIQLKPSADDLDSSINYTCCGHIPLHEEASEACQSFIVEVPKAKELVESETSTSSIYVLASILGMLVLSLLSMLIFCKLTVKPRDLLPRRVIVWFLDGGDLAKGDPKVFSISFRTTSKIINPKYLRIDNSDRCKEGNFGKVWFGELTVRTSTFTRCWTKPETIKVAIKEPKLDGSKYDAFLSFLKEIKIIASLKDHPNVVTFIGATATKKNLANYKTAMVLEYCCGGDLESYFNMHRDHFDNTDIGGGRTSRSTDFKLITYHLIKWALEIASGMEHISKSGIIHVDLAARNILLHSKCEAPTNDFLDPELLTAKIGDFGQSKDLNKQPKNYYLIVGERQMPMFLLAPEVLKNFKLTPESDIWALGVLYWEIFSLGAAPYSKESLEFEEGCTDSTRQALLDHFASGNILSKPEFAPNEMWNIIQKCLKIDPSERPSFAEIRGDLQALIESYPNLTMETEPVPISSYSRLAIDGTIQLPS